MFSGHKHLPVYAILRVDAHPHEHGPFSRRVTVKKIVLNEAYAVAEAERLNLMNASKGCTYIVQLTELDETLPQAND
jgi:hypothetical protein